MIAKPSGCDGFVSSDTSVNGHSCFQWTEILAQQSIQNMINVFTIEVFRLPEPPLARKAEASGHLLTGGVGTGALQFDAIKPQLFEAIAERCMHRRCSQSPALVLGAQVIPDCCLVVALFDVVDAHCAAQALAFEDVPLEQFAFERCFAGLGKVFFRRLDRSETVDLGQVALEAISVPLNQGG